jgi:hypothetical protein
MTAEKFLYRLGLVLLYGGIVVVLGAVTCAGCFFLVILSPSFSLPPAYQVFGNDSVAILTYILSDIFVWVVASYFSVRAIYKRRSRLLGTSPSIPKGNG